MEIQRTKIEKKDIDSYFKKEIDRVMEAIDEAKRKYGETVGGIITADKVIKSKELKFAIAMGEKYLNALRVKADGFHIR